jgi:pimeloyl-ACP methyl ester carboxylesterase
MLGPTIRWWSQLLLAVLLALQACAPAPKDGGVVPDVWNWSKSDAQTWDSSAEPRSAWYGCQVDGAQEMKGLKCLDLAVPLDHAQPAGPAIQLRVYRFAPASMPPRAQLWILQGGPGASGATLAGMAELLRKLDPDLEMLVPDHRGTGDSTWLHCQAAAGGQGGPTVIDPEEVAACTAEIDTRLGPGGLAAFSATQAAGDLAYAIDALGSADVPVYVYGVSYGTYWAHRYLQRYAGQATGVVLDSICPPQLCKLVSYDKNFDDVARELLRRCADFSACRQFMGADPVAKAEATVAKLDKGHCPDLQALGLDRSGLRRVLASLTASQGLRAFLPAVLHRIDRCAQADIQALSHMMEEVNQASAPTVQKDFSAVLHHNVMYSELFAPEPAPSAAQVQQWLDQAIAAPETTVKSFALEPLWPKYPVGADSSQWAGTQTPVLMLQGGLDPQTPLAWGQALATHLNGGQQCLKVVPDAAHGVLFGSPWHGGKGDCALLLLRQFMDDPSTSPDHACQNDTDPLHFTPDAKDVFALLGSQSLWLPAPHQAQAMQSARQQPTEALRRWRQWLREHPRM